MSDNRVRGQSNNLCLPGIPQHTIQRGNNRQICFADGVVTLTPNYELTLTPN